MAGLRRMARKKVDMEANVKIVIAMHKPYRIPKGDCYFPLHVGREGKKGFGITGDDTGDHISFKNPYYCELTGVYWAWKNLEADYVGLVHYRRYFGKRGRMGGRDRFAGILTDEEIRQLVSRYPVILPKKRRYYIETLYTHYAHTHYSEHLDMTREIVERLCPEYLPSFDRTMKSRSGHMFNMFIMQKALADAYCEWLFAILSELEKKIDITQYDAFQARLFGRVSEFLLDIWIRKNNIAYHETPTCFLGEIDWTRKVISFVKAKVCGKKYDKSF